MPRYREPFTLFPRKLKSGKIVYYYRTYTQDGIRTVAHSTGQTNKTLARQYCFKLLEQGILCTGLSMSFRNYAQDFFSDDSQWMLDKIQAGAGKKSPVSQNTIKTYRYCVNSFLLPFFSNIKLNDIKTLHVKKFRAFLLEKKLSNSLINLSCACLKIIFSYAKTDGYMTCDPFSTIQQMYINARAKDTFSEEEFVRLFKKTWESYDRKLFALTSALTGMRISEVAAINRESLHDNFIDVSAQFYNGNLHPVKDDGKRKVRISKNLYSLLQEHMKGRYFIFEENQDTYRRSFNSNTALSEETRKKRGITFHSLRHFFNTYLLAHGISESKVKFLMGHSSGKGSITERYTNFSPSDFNDVAEIQDNLLFSLKH